MWYTITSTIFRLLDKRAINYWRILLRPKFINPTISKIWQYNDFIINNLWEYAPIGISTYVLLKMSLNHFDTLLFSAPSSSTYSMSVTQNYDIEFCMAPISTFEGWFITDMCYMHGACTECSMLYHITYMKHNSTLL